jgi:hypothetical protein
MVSIVCSITLCRVAWSLRFGKYGMCFRLTGAHRRARRPRASGLCAGRERGPIQAFMRESYASAHLGITQQMRRPAAAAQAITTHTSAPHWFLASRLLLIGSSAALLAAVFTPHTSHPASQAVRQPQSPLYPPPAAGMSAAASVYDFTVRDIMRREVPMRDLLGGKVALIVNGE